MTDRSAANLADPLSYHKEHTCQHYGRRHHCARAMKPANTSTDQLIPK